MSTTPPTGRREWEDVKNLATQLKSVSGALTAVVTALPLSGIWWTAFMPPWPSGSYIIAVVASIFTVFVLFFVFREAKPAEMPSPRAALWLGAGAGLCLIAYLALLASLVADVDSERHVKGFGLTAEAAKAVADGKVSADTKDLLAHFGYYSEDRIWAARPLAQLLLLLTFCAAVVLDVTCFSLFMIRNFVLDKAPAPTPSLPPQQTNQ